VVLKCLIFLSICWKDAASYSHIKLEISAETHIGFYVNAHYCLILKETGIEQQIFNPHTTNLINLLKPTGYMLHQQFNIQQLYALPTLYLCKNKQ
jgi:hypothetical protein